MANSKIENLRNEMEKMFKEVCADPRRAPQAHEVANLGGKILNSIAVQVKYSAELKKGKIEKIPYMEGE